jgi:YegS/Rv2252/BmrU family lipid kinase
VPAQTLVILNPRAGSGLSRFGRLQGLLREALGDVEIARTRAPRDAIRLAREAVRAGVGRIVVGGGDGTVSEVATGILEAGLGGHAEIGLLPMGSGCDFARSVGVPLRIGEAVALLRDGGRMRVDAGRVTYRTRDGDTRTSCFLNEAGFGLSGVTVDLVNRAGKRFGPKLSFALGSIGAILRGGTTAVRVRVDERTIFEGPVSLVVAANGRHFGGGMRIAPEARIDDGVLDVIVVEDLGRMRLLSRFPSLYRGTHLDYAEAHFVRGTRVEAVPLGPAAAPLDVDGEAVGALPVAIELLPKAIGLFGLPRHVPAAPRPD